MEKLNNREGETMALIKCNECGKEVSDQAAACPNCGAPIAPKPPLINQQPKVEVRVTQEKKKGSCLKTILIVLLAFCILMIIIGNTVEDDEEAISENNSQESFEVEVIEETGIKGIEVQKENKYGDIEDFSYELSDGKIILSSYDGKDEIIEIRPTYIVEGTEYKTDLSDFSVGIGNHRVESLILCEGIEEVKTSIFNSSDVEKIFFPKSMKNVYDYTLSYLHPSEGNTIKIYYAGTQEEWAQIFTEYKRTKVEDTELGEEMGQAIADKLNEMMGSEYDSSIFEYFFSANPDELKK